MNTDTGALSLPDRAGGRITVFYRARGELCPGLHRRLGSWWIETQAPGPTGRFGGGNRVTSAMDFDFRLQHPLAVGKFEPRNMKRHANGVREALAAAERGPLPEVLVEDDVSVWALWDGCVQELDKECLAQPLTNWWGAAPSAQRWD